MQLEQGQHQLVNFLKVYHSMLIEYKWLCYEPRQCRQHYGWGLAGRDAEAVVPVWRQEGERAVAAVDSPLPQRLLCLPLLHHTAGARR